MTKRLIHNDRLPRPSSSFKGTSNRVTLLGTHTGELGMNEHSHMDEEEICDPESEWRDAHGIFRANALEPLPDFE